MSHQHVYTSFHQFVVQQVSTLKHILKCYRETSVISKLSCSCKNKGRGCMLTLLSCYIFAITCCLMISRAKRIFSPFFQNACLLTDWGNIKRRDLRALKCVLRDYMGPENDLDGWEKLKVIIWHWITRQETTTTIALNECLPPPFYLKQQMELDTV